MQLLLDCCNEKLVSKENVSRQRQRFKLSCLAAKGKTDWRIISHLLRGVDAIRRNNGNQANNYYQPWLSPQGDWMFTDEGSHVTWARPVTNSKRLEVLGCSFGLKAIIEIVIIEAQYLAVEVLIVSFDGLFQSSWLIWTSLMPCASSFTNNKK